MNYALETPAVKRIINECLHSPIEEFCSRPGKNLRARLVRIGLNLSSPNEKLVPKLNQEKLQCAESIIEGIHSGSLIVDDIQDESSERRNAPSLHIIHGVPLALNAGNWLYFHALSQVQCLELESQEEKILLSEILDLMMKAHTGQALDLGSKIKSLPQNEVYSTCMASMELKTGTLLNMALLLGSSLNPQKYSGRTLSELGMRLGVLLQMMDDIGNTFGQSSKSFEDILHQRPTWIWAVASTLPESEYKQFINAVSSPENFMSWVRENDFATKVHEATTIYKKEVIAMIRHEWFSTHPQTINEIFNMIHLLEKAYA